ncbi:helix-turn-helix domain-containing protein [Undibacterium cyanobacteriorum]|uniref:Helix-turn-helix domain-containing protein n=1 Tax=Undibacterium cyanobacteriorum TaxID=3073561 RepID=A0ABY9RIA6_9BURK|nr:helix-turn-helix domain-containing protein [Undibacterium sp. 20NA77.5]WMW80052.1 helix-turn-helix domain-containing protein [Undibacterium sp. 20NA77.5]
MPKPRHRPWIGQLAITTGAAYFQGAAGDNQAHRHWVDQYVFARQPFLLNTEQASITTHAVYIPSQQRHQLIASEPQSLFLDPTSKLSRLLKLRFHLDQVGELPPSLTQSLFDAFDPLLNAQHAHFDTLLRNFEQAFMADRVSIKHQIQEQFKTQNSQRLEIVLSLIHQQQIHELKALAQAVDLSPSRFSHWFSEQTGIALRSYSKWTRLIVALEHLSAAASIAEAAYAAGFSDQAHLQKSFIACFGIAPGQLKLSGNRSNAKARVQSDV